MNKITVFLNLGLQGLGIKTFVNIDVNDTVNSFLLKVADQEGAIGCEWIRMSTGKPITGTTHGDKLLKDFGWYNEMTLWGSLRLKGGATVSLSNMQSLFKKVTMQLIIKNPVKIDVNAVKHFGGEVVTRRCDICFDNKLNVKLPCTHTYCYYCMDTIIKKQLNNCESDISCCICHKTVNTILAYTIAGYSNQQKSSADKTLFNNNLKKPTSMMSMCSNLSCKQIIMRQPLNGNKLNCTKCNKQTCQLCKSKWINNDVNNKDYCGNDVCDPSKMYQTCLDYAKDKMINNVMVTDTRFCPKCLRVNIHEVACKHITCGCGHQYCHVCLQDWSVHKSDDCIVHDKQVITKDMILKLSQST